jgi:hypothetical protein
MGAPKGGICMLFIGIDWSRDKYDICICNEYGARICQLTITVTLAGFMRLEQERLKLQIPAQQCVVAIETESTLLVDFLLERGYVIYIIPPHATNAYRQIEKLSIAHNDQSDAALLAWVARVDRRRHRRLRPKRLMHIRRGVARRGRFEYEYGKSLPEELSWNSISKPS